MDFIYGLWPVLAVARILGFCPIRVRGPPFARQISATTFHLLLSLLIISVYLSVKIFFMPKLTRITASSVTGLIGNMTAMVTFIALHITFIWKRKFLAVLIERWSGLPSPKNLRRNLMIGLAIVFIGLMIILTLELLEYFFTNRYKELLTNMIYRKIAIIDEFSNIISEFIFLSYVHLVESEFKRQINNKLEALLNDSMTPCIIESLDFKSKPEVTPEERILQIKESHYRICQMASEINSTFSLANLFNVASTFIWITYSAYMTIFLLLEKEIPIFFLSSVLGWFLLEILRLWALALVCSHTLAEAERTSEIVHKGLVIIKDKGLRKELESFSLQLHHRKIGFSANGFFPIDNTLIFTVIGGSTTYIIILLQYRNTLLNN